MSDEKRDRGVTQITAEQVKALREHTGAGMDECKRALERAAGDVPLAAGFLRMNGLAVFIKGDRAAWERRGAEQWAAEYRKDGTFK